MPTRAGSASALIAAAVLLLVVAPSAPSSTVEGDLPVPSPSGWRWPVDAVRLAHPYEAPAHEYGPGHRGLDLVPEGSEIRAPADGVIAFAGPVAGRGVITIDHGDGLVTTLEPVQHIAPAGTPVARGEAVATLAEGGHAAIGTLHFGVRRDGEYINPLLLLGGVPRAVLLPCC